MPRLVKIALAVTLSLTMAGCAHVGGPAAGPPRPTEAWIAGKWVLKGESCAGNSGVLYRPDGSWISEGLTGEWRIVRSELRLDIIGEQMPSGMIKPILPPKRFEDLIVELGPDDYLARRANSPDRHFVRCPKQAP